MPKDKSDSHNRIKSPKQANKEGYRHMDHYYTNFDPSNRRYSEEELQDIRERYLGKKEEAQGGVRSGNGRLASAWKAVLSLLAERERGARGGWRFEDEVAECNE